MNYQETLDYLYQRLPMFQRVGSKAFKKNLDNSFALDDALGNPHREFRSLHIAGTNGKGSVSNMLASILQESGFKVGLYTSPHLRSFTERIRINGEPIPEAKVIEFVERLKPDIERIAPSFFEVTVAMAFDHFRNEKVDFAVIEVGLGGRLDSTNIIHPFAGAITNISFDHVNFLGNTLAKIAFEKAGIFKEGIPFVIGEGHPETLPVFEKVAREKGANIVLSENVYELHKGFLDIDDKHITLKNDRGKLSFYKLGLLGEFQARNARTALVLVEQLVKMGVEIDHDSIHAGFGNVAQNTGFRGRMSILQEEPTVLTDVGHNEAGVKEVLKAIGRFKFDRLHMVWGMVNDKDRKKILAMLPKNARFYFVRPDVPRGLDANTLQEEALESGLNGEAWPSVQAGLDAALEAADKDDFIFVGGSTFVVAEIV